ncbi:MAG: LacI family DNA-binding transcriptional regulator [Candidatus Promineifilaceae bacterium]
MSHLGQMNQKPAAPTIHDVARRSGVSISTVSRVINANVPVSDAAAARVQAAMQELKYVPRAAARSLALRQNGAVGLLVSELLGDFFGPLLTGIEEVVTEQGYDLLISTSGRRGAPRELPGSLGSHNTDGLLIFAGALSDAGVVHAHSLGLPMVLVHRPSPPGLGLPCVTIENKAASRAIVEHLIAAHGRRRIVLLRGLADNDDSHWREMGYQEALSQHQLPLDPALALAGDFDREVAGRSIRQLVAAAVPFDAVFAGDDEAAVGVLQALQSAGKRVPEDVAVVGFDDQRLAAVTHPPLTTVHAPTAKVGRAAAQQLLALVRTGRAEPLTLLPTELIIRRSCGCEP